MNKKTLFLGIDLFLLFQLVIVIFTGIVEHHPMPTMHAAMGLGLITTACIHGVVLHWRWVGVALQRYQQMSGAARSNAKLVLVLFSGYILCGITGLAMSKGPSHLLRHLHHLSILTVIVAQSIHLARHWKWIWATLMGTPGKAAEVRVVK